MCVIQITWNQAFESLLPGGVPELESDNLAGDSYIFGNEINSDGGLDRMERIHFWWGQIRS